MLSMNHNHRYVVNSVKLYQKIKFRLCNDVLNIHKKPYFPTHTDHIYGLFFLYAILLGSKSQVHFLYFIKNLMELRFKTSITILNSTNSIEFCSLKRTIRVHWPVQKHSNL